MEEDYTNDQLSINLSSKELPALVEGRDYYLERGYVVFTADFLLRRGYCCESGCRHCPYGEDAADAASAKK